MSANFLKLTVTESVRKAQEHYFGGSQTFVGTPELDALTEDEVAFIQARDSFYIASISESGWPYVQHRGGRVGFLRVLNPQTLAFADTGAIASCFLSEIWPPTTASRSS